MQKPDKAAFLSQVILQFFCCLIFTLVVPAQTNTPAETDSTIAALDNPAVVRTLLREVSLLRLVLQKTNYTGTYAQILAERIRIQQERIERLTKDLEAMRDQLTEVKMQQAKTAELLRELESQISREQLNLRRNELLLQQRLLKLEQEKFHQLDQRLREREAQMSTLINVEQAKLTELTDKLDELEKSLEQQDSFGKVQPKTKKP